MQLVAHVGEWFGSCYISLNYVAAEGSSNEIIRQHKFTESGNGEEPD